MNRFLLTRLELFAQLREVCGENVVLRARVVQLATENDLARRAVAAARMELRSAARMLVHVSERCTQAELNEVAAQQAASRLQDKVNLLCRDLDALTGMSS